MSSDRTIARLGVIETGECAVRVLNAVGGLNNADDASPITTVLIHDGVDPEPWFAREADEVRTCGVSPTIDEVVDCLRQAQIDTVWLGGRLSQERVDLIQACEVADIAVVGPDAETVRRVTDVADRHHPDAAAGDAETSSPRRRVEVDILADDHGTVWVLGGRDVSIARDAGPLIAEAPCSAIGADLAHRIRHSASELVRAVGYRGAGVAEFFHDGTDFELVGFDCVAAPDHATTEERTGASVIGWRLRVQRGERLPLQEPAGDGIVVEARLLAEDPDHDFSAASGRVALLSFPVGTGVRVDANRRVGDVVDPSDPLIAVITAWGPDRSVAVARLRRALERTAIVIDGGATNRMLLVDLLGRDDFLRNDLDTEWLDRTLAERSLLTPSVVALLAAAVEAYETDRADVQRSFYASAERGRPQQPADVGSGLQLGYCGESYVVDVDCVGPHRYTVRHGADVADVTVDALDAFERRLTIGDRRHRLVVAPTLGGFRVELDAASHTIDREDGAVLRSGWPALVVSALVEPGDEVHVGDPIAVLESMKMETTVTAPIAGRVMAVSIMPNTQIERGAPLVRIRPHQGDVPVSSDGARRVDLSGLSAKFDPTRKPCDRVYVPLGDYLLGYDSSPAALRKLVTQQRRLAEIADPDDAALLACEDGLLDIYAELGALYRPETETETDDLIRTEHTQEFLVSFLQWLDPEAAGLPAGYRERLQRALERFGVRSLDRTPALEAAMMWLFRSFARLGELSPVVIAILERRLMHRDALGGQADASMRERLDRLVAATQGRQQTIADLARDVRFHYFDEPPMEAAAIEVWAEMAGHLDHLVAAPDSGDRSERLDRLVWCPLPMRSVLLEMWRSHAHSPHAQQLVLEIYLRRLYRIWQLDTVSFHDAGGYRFASVAGVAPTGAVRVIVGYVALDELPDWSHVAASTLGSGGDTLVDVVTWREGERPEIDDTAADVVALAARSALGSEVRRLDVTVSSTDGPAEDRFRLQSVSLERSDEGSFVEVPLYRNLHPMLAERLELWRLSNFELERRPSPEDVYLFDGVARTNPRDHRLFALAEVRDLIAATDPVTGELTYPRLERVGLLALAAMRAELARYAPRERPLANRLVLDVTAPWTLPAEETERLAHRFAPLGARVGLQKLVLKVRIPDGAQPDGLREAVLHVEDVGHRILIREDRAGDEPVRPLSAYQQKVLTAARFGSPYPYEIVRLMTSAGAATGLPADSFEELDLDPDVDPTTDDRLIPVVREPGTNTAHVVVGLLTNHSEVVPEGMTRVAILSDPTQGLGNLAEPECRRINAALAYALEHRLPVEWFAVSSGALIAMDSGTENMDWIALTLRRIIEFTQAGGEINVVVTGINVGGQPYWNAEATMLTHTKGILVMTPASAMVLTGKQALDFSGAVSAEDNHGIGGYHRVMGPNGQAQYWASSFGEACALLLRHYELTYVVPGERFPRRRPTIDPVDRDVRSSPHAELVDCVFTSVGDVFSAELNPERKQPFDMRSVMRSVADADGEPLERWKDLGDADTTIVWDTTIGGIPVCLLGIESHTVGRKGFVPADGPPAWTSGTLFPQASRKAARAINAASANRPLVVLANLSGFDGSPESMRRRQLEYGAEIGRAVTNFDGPIVFVVVSRYHGGAFVVFSKALNASMEIAAVEGSYASVIGGAPAAATVFAREVKQRTEADPRVREAVAAATEATGPEAARLRTAVVQVTEQVRSEKLGEVADEFDAIHTIERALEVGSVDRIIAAADLRPYVVDALERGMATHT